MATRKTTATATKSKASKAKAAPAPEPEVEEEIDSLEIAEDGDEVEEIEEEAPKAKAKKGGKKTTAKPAAEDGEPKKAKRPPVERGTNWLVDHVNAECGTEYKGYDVRVLLRKMAKNGEFERQVGEDRSRYEFTGADDPIVKAVVAKVKGGEIESSKKESLAKLKEAVQGKKAKGDKAGKKAKKAKKSAE